MVYESDFYTTRRPYTRPTVTSYSVTRRSVPWHLVPTVPRPSQVPPCYTAFGCKGFADYDDDDLIDYPYFSKIQPYHKHIPYIGHKRLVIVQPSAHGWRVKPSTLMGEIDRIYHKVRPSLAYNPKEDFLNSRSILSFDDETRSIRAKTAELLKKIHTPVPRAQRPLPLPGELADALFKLRHELSEIAVKLVRETAKDDDRLYYSHTELPITERITSDNYIDRLLTSSRPSAHPHVPAITQQEEPKYNRLGNGHLACVTYAGGRPISRRRNLASDYIKNDINVLSHYNRFRQAAEKAPHAPDSEYGSIPHLPPTRSPVTGSWKSNAPRRTQSDKIMALRMTSDDDAIQERKKSRREQLEEEAKREAEQEKRRDEELKRQEELAQQAAAERQAELERKAREEEEERILREEAERMEALRKEEEERRAKEEEEARLAKEEEERKAKEADAKRKAKEEAARKAEEERKAREEEERRIKEEEERKAKEDEERRLKEEEEQRQREEEEQRQREEEEQRQREEEERLAKEEEERRIKEEEERKAKEEEEAAHDEEPAEEENEEAGVEETADNPQQEEVKEDEAEETEGDPVVEEPEEAPAKATEEAEEEEEADEEEED